jgi:hypothetical protein
MRHCDEVKTLLGKRVRVRLGDHQDKPVIITGQLLGFGDGGDFEILEDDGFVHYCWPMLDVEETMICNYKWTLRQEGNSCSRHHCTRNEFHRGVHVCSCLARL